MKKDVRITIAIGDITMTELTELLANLEELTSQYPIQDTNVQIGDAGKYIRPPYTP